MRASLQTSLPWWTFRPRKKMFGPPLPCPTNTLPAPRSPALTRPGEPAPSWGFQQEVGPPPSRRLGLPLPTPPEQKKLKISETSTKLRYLILHVCSTEDRKAKARTERKNPEIHQAHLTAMIIVQTYSA